MYPRFLPDKSNKVVYEKYGLYDLVENSFQTPSMGFRGAEQTSSFLFSLKLTDLHLHSRCVLGPYFKAVLQVKITSPRGCKQPDFLYVMLRAFIPEHTDNRWYSGSTIISHISAYNAPSDMIRPIPTNLSLSNAEIHFQERSVASRNDSSETVMTDIQSADFNNCLYSLSLGSIHLHSITDTSPANFFYDLFF